jgi:hypothetical protein
MDIESLQIKRITGNWDTHKTRLKPEDGEMIFIEKGVITTDSPGYIVIGNGTKTVEELVNDSSRVVLFKEEVSTYITNLYPNTSTQDNPGNISNNVSLGDSKHFARANHSHKIDNRTINDIVQSSSTLDDIVLRKVYAGTDIPSPDKGSVGDIYIKYEKN